MRFSVTCLAQCLAQKRSKIEHDIFVIVARAIDVTVVLQPRSTASCV